MKKGTQNDPFADDLTDDEPDSEDDIPSKDTKRPDPEPEATHVDDEPVTSSPDVPWAVERDSVKSERGMVQFYLREFVQADESEFKRDVEEETGYDVYTTDLREAAYLVAMEHPEEVASLLNEWGCEYA